MIADSINDVNCKLFCILEMLILRFDWSLNPSDPVRLNPKDSIDDQAAFVSLKSDAVQSSSEVIDTAKALDEVCIYWYLIDNATTAYQHGPFPPSLKLGSYWIV